MIKNHFCTSILTATLVISGSVGFAQTRTVSKDGLKNHTHIQAAIGFFNPDPDPVTPNIIQVTDSAVYEEVITVDVPVTIEGTGPSKPVLALQANSNGRAGSAGLVVKLPATMSTGTVVLRNLTLLPSKSPETTPASAAVHVANNNAFVFFDGSLITTNDGFDQPVSTTGLVNVTTESTHISFGDDGIVGGGTDNGQFEGAGLEILLRNTVMTHLRGNKNGNPEWTSGTCTAVIVEKTTSTVNRLLTVADGCIFSFNNGRGLEVDGDFDLNSPNQKSIVALNSEIGLYFNGDSPNLRRVKSAIISGNAQVGIYESTNEGFRTTVEDSIVAGNARQGFRISGLATSTLTIVRSTVGRPTGATYEAVRVDGAPTDVIFDNSIVLGSGAINTSLNRINNIADGTYTFINSALVAGGPHFINLFLADISKLATEPSILTDPQFANTSDFTSPDFFAVQSSSYANVGTGGTPLSGGGLYIGPPALAPPTEVEVTVSKTSAAQFTTLQAALDSLILDVTKKYTVKVLDNSVYDEVLTIDVPATIVGTGASRPVLAVQENAAGYDIDGSAATTNWSGNAGLLIDIPISVSTCTVALKNLIVIPSRTGTPPVAGIVNKANNFYLEMENILVTGNNGSDAPIATDGMTNVPADPGQTHFTVSGGHIGSARVDRLDGDGVEVRMRDCIFTNIRATVATSWKTGFYMCRTNYNAPNVPNDERRPTAFRHLTLEGKCMFTYNDANGLRTASSLVIKSGQDYSMFVGNEWVGLWLDTEKGRNQINGVNASNNPTYIGFNEGVGGTGPRAYLTNAIIANNGGYGAYHRLGDANQFPTKFQNVTIANNSLTLTNHRQMQLSSSGSGRVRVDTLDTIYAGKGVSDPLEARNVGDLSNAATLNLVSTAVVTEGPLALNDPPIIIIPSVQTAAINGDAVTNADPNFLNTTDPFAPNFYAVQNSVYGQLASDGTPLRGGGSYIPPAGVGEWTLY